MRKLKPKLIKSNKLISLSLSLSFFFLPFLCFAFPALSFLPSSLLPSLPSFFPAFLPSFPPFFHSSNN